MGQYFNFGDQIGGLLQEALNRTERAKQFDEQQAFEYMRLNEAAKQWKAGYDLEKDYKNKDLKLKVLQDIDNRYVSEEAAKSVLGANHPLFSSGVDSNGKKAGRSADEIATPYAGILGNDVPKLPQGTYYEKEVIQNALASLRAAKIEAEIKKLGEAGGEGFDPTAISRIPVEQVSGRTEPYTNIARLPGESLAFRSKAYTDKANSFQTGRDNADREQLLRDEIAKNYPEIRLQNYGRVEYDFDKKEYKLYQAMPATNFSGPDVNKVDEFVANEYPKLLSSLTKMSALDQQRSAPQIAQVGLLLKQMSLTSPKYARLADPFLAIGSKYLQDVQQKQMELSSQDERSKQSNAVRLILNAAKSDPRIQEQVNQAAPQLLDEYWSR